MEPSPIAPSATPASRFAARSPNHLHERNRSQSSSVTGSRNAFFIPPLQLGRPVTPPPLSPRSAHGQDISDTIISLSRQTPLQRNLAHLARLGFHGVTSGPGDNANSDTLSAGSPPGSFVNVGSTIPTVNTSGASVSSNLSNSIGSIKGRFSRLGGNLNFGRRD